MKEEPPREDFNDKMGQVEISREGSGWGKGTGRRSPGSIRGPENALSMHRAVVSSSAFWRIILAQADPRMRIQNENENSSLDVNPVSRPPAQTKINSRLGLIPDEALSPCM